MTNNDQDYEMCFRIDNVVLPKNGYFGISAATGMVSYKILKYCHITIYVGENSYTPPFSYISIYLGGLADDHDILHFLTLSLYPPGQLIPVDGHKVSVEEHAKLQQEYFDYKKKLDEQKEEYRK